MIYNSCQAALHKQLPEDAINRTVTLFILGKVSESLEFLRDALPQGHMDTKEHMNEVVKVWLRILNETGVEADAYSALYRCIEGKWRTSRQ